MAVYELSLAYSDTALTTLTKASLEAAADGYATFNPAEFFTPKKIYEVVDNLSLRGKRFKHRKFGRYFYTIIISTNELDEVYGTESTKLAFLRSFFDAEYKYLLKYGDTSYVEVDSEDDELITEYAEGILYVPEITLNLFDVEKT